MRKFLAILALLIMFSISGVAVEQSHPITQLMVPDSSPENQFDMRDGAVTFESGGLVGEHSQGNLMIADAYNQRPVWVGSPQADQQDIKVFGELVFDYDDNKALDLSNGNIEGLNTIKGFNVINDANIIRWENNVPGPDPYNTQITGGGGNGLSIDGGESSVSIIPEEGTPGSSSLPHLRGAGVVLEADRDGDNAGTHYCKLDKSGSWSCTGPKNFVQEINKTHEAVYTSSESSEVVVEWTSSTKADEKGVEVKFPEKYGKVLSEEEDYHVTATPVGSLADVGVFDKSDEGFTLKADRPTEVDFHVRGIRKGYGDKKALRKK